MNLAFTKVDEFDDLVWPDRCREITQDSPALSVFTDFQSIRPLVIESSALAYEAEELIRKEHVTIKIVVDADNHFCGVVDLEELNHPDFLARMVSVYTRDSLTIAEVMRSKNVLEALIYAELEMATVGDVLHAMREYTYHHCLVADTSASQIRGLISVSDIAKMLKVKIDLQHMPSFAELYLTANN